MSFTSEIQRRLQSSERDLQELIAVFSDDPDKDYVLADSLVKMAYADLVSARKFVDLSNIRTLWAYRAAITNLYQAVERAAPSYWGPLFRIAQSDLDESIFT